MFCQSSISLKDRLKHTPKVQSDRGYWTGERGNSIYCPKHNDTVLDALHKFDLPGMPYIDGMLDSRQCTIGTVCLTQMSTKRYKNFSECDRLCAELWNSINYLNYNHWTKNVLLLIGKVSTLGTREMTAFNVI